MNETSVTSEWRDFIFFIFCFFVCLFGVLIFDQVKLEAILFYVSDSSLYKHETRAFFLSFCIFLGCQFMLWYHKKLQFD